MSRFTNPVFDAAEAYASAGLSIIPIRPDASKAPCVAWKQYQSRIAGPEERSQWWSNGSNYGIAVVAGSVSGELEMLDFDDIKAFEEWGEGIRDCFPDLIKRLVVVKTPRPGIQVPYRCAGKAGVNQVLARDEGGGVRIETRGEGGYFLTYPTGPDCHPAHKPYVLKHGSLTEVPTIGEDHRALFLSMAKMLDRCEIPFPDPQPAATTYASPSGSRPGDDYNQRGDHAALLSGHGWVREGTRGEVEYWRRPGKDHGHSATWNGAGPRVFCVFSTNAAPLEGHSGGAGYDLFGMYARLENGGDFIAAAKSLSEQGFGPLPKPEERSLKGTTKTTEVPAESNYVVSVVPFLQEAEAIPPLALEPEALYGLPGMVVNAIAPCTESSPAAILASFLVGVGCLIGRGPHVYRDGAYHGVNEFACLVGLTSAGRKGTATRRAEEILAAVGDVLTISERDILSVYDMHEARARSWRDLLLPGLGSGEALVASLAAAKGQEACPRRLVLEEEFSKPLRIMQREGSTLSETLRAAWDGSILANVTKAKSLRVPSSHVSILAHITENEMKLRLGAAEMFNGFANRFLWFCTTRAQSLPFGGGDAPTAPAVAALRQSLLQVRHTKRVEFDKEVKHIWDKGKVYELLLNRPPGLLGAVTSRGEVHVTRLSLLYALLDGESEIRLPHLMAALAVWDFSEKSAAYLFGQSTGDDCADTILELLQDVYPGGLTRTEIRDGFRRNAAPGRIPAALLLLERGGKARRTSMEGGSPGRPTEIWCCTSAKTHDKNDITPLSLARSLL